MVRIILAVCFSLISLNCYCFEETEDGQNTLYMEKMDSNGAHFEFIVNVGTAYLDCAHYHDLHILEHLVYSTLNSKLMAYGIQNPIEAKTEMLRTRFSFNLPSSFTDDPEKVRAIFKSIVTPDWKAFEIEKSVIARELVELKIDDDSSNAFLDVYKLGIPQLGQPCKKIPKIGTITINEIKQTFASVYSQASTTVVVTGNFNFNNVKLIANETFKSQPKSWEPVKYSTTFKPSIALLENKVIAAAPIPGLKKFNGHNLIVLRNAIRTKLIETLRTQKGIVYSVDVQIQSNDAVGFITIEIPVENKHIDQVVTSIKNLFISGYLTKVDIENANIFLSNQYRSIDLTPTNIGVQIAEYRLGAMPSNGYPNNFINPLLNWKELSVVDYRRFAIWREVAEIIGG